MATIVVEDGTVVSGANSYVSESELTQYASDREIVVNSSLSTLLIKAMDYIESLSFIGMKHTEDQPLQWPRDEVWVDGYYIERETIPKELKRGQMAVALAIEAGNGPLDTVERGVKREKADVVEIEYMDNAPAEVINRTINAALKKLLVAGGGFQVVRV